MRDYPSDKFSFNNSVEKSIKQMVHLEPEDLRNRVVDNSNFHSDNLTFFYLKDLTKMDAIRLSIYSWYAPEEVGFVLRMDLSTKINTFDYDTRIILNLILKSKAEMLIFLQETNIWHSRELFGNILSKKVSLDTFFKVSPLRRKINRPQRKRGYHDHGSRVPEHKRKPKFDWSLTAKMNEIYQERESFDDTLLFLEGFLS